MLALMRADDVRADDVPFHAMLSYRLWPQGRGMSGSAQASSTTWANEILELETICPQVRPWRAHSLAMDQRLDRPSLHGWILLGSCVGPQSHRASWQR